MRSSFSLCSTIKSEFLQFAFLTVNHRHHQLRPFPDRRRCCFLRRLRLLRRRRLLRLASCFFRCRESPKSSILKSDDLFINKKNAKQKVETVNFRILNRELEFHISRFEFVDHVGISQTGAAARNSENHFKTSDD